MKKIRLKIILTISMLVVIFSSIQFYYAYRQIQDSVDHLHQEQLDIALNFELSIREYVSQILRPMVGGYLPEDEFIPEIMSSSYVSRLIFEKVRNRFPDLVVKFSSDNPRNPANRGSASEINLIAFFNAHPEIREWTDEISLSGIEYLARFRPMRMEQRCLACHGDPADAPPGLLARYGDTASFHLPIDRVVGLETVALPAGMSKSTIMKQTVRNFSFIFGAILCLFFSIVLVLRFMINDRRLAERVLAENEKEKSIILDSLHDSVFYFGSPKLDLVWSNRRALDMTGLTAEELSRTPCFQYMGKEKPCENCPVLATFASGSADEAEIQTPEGKWWYVRSFPVNDTAGKLKGVVKVVSDITARRIAEKMVEESRERYRLIFNLAPVGIFHFDQNGVITECNHQFVRMMGSSHLKLIGINMLENLSDSAVLKQLQAALQGEKSHYEGWYTSVTGERKLFLNVDFMPVRDAQGRVTGGIGVNADLTERVNAEQMVRESEEKYRLLAETSSDGIYEIDTGGKITYASSASEHIFGYSVKEVIGNHFNRYFQEPESVQAMQLFEQVVGGERIKSRHLVIRAKDGSTVHVEASVTPIIRNGRVDNIQVIGRNITERIRIQRELADSELKYRLIFNSASVGFFYFDTNGVISDNNPKAQEMMGAGAHQIAGFDLLSGIENLQVLQAIKSCLNGIYAGYEGEYTSVTGGRTRHLKADFVPIVSSKDQVIGGLCVAEDITLRVMAEAALLSSEEKARTLLDAASDGIVLLDGNGKILDLNATYAAHFDKPKAELIGACVWELYSAQIARDRKHQLEKVFVSGEPVSMVDVEEGRWFYAHIHPIRDASGNITRVAVFARDITKLRAAEDALTAAKERMQQLSRHLQAAREQERKGIAREIHDELGQALTAIKLEAAWMSKKMLSDAPVLKSKAEMVTSLANEAIQSVKRIITRLRPALLNDLGLAEAVRWQAEDLQTRSGIDFHVTIDPETIDCGDDLSTAIFRVFQEAATNAVRHAEASRVDVLLHWKGGRIMLEVADNGKGFLDEQMEKENSFGILGMKERAYAFGGEIHFSGNPGNGTRVQAWFPLASG